MLANDFDDWLVIADSNGREIVWEYGRDGRSAKRAFRTISETGRTHDTECRVFSATLKKGGRVVGHFETEA